MIVTLLVADPVLLHSFAGVFQVCGHEGGACMTHRFLRLRHGRDPNAMANMLASPASMAPRPGVLQLNGAGINGSMFVNFTQYRRPLHFQCPNGLLARYRSSSLNTQPQYFCI